MRSIDALAGMAIGKRRGGSWSPPGAIGTWFNSHETVAAGGTWTDSIGGDTITLASGIGVTQGTGMVVSSPNWTQMNSSFTPNVPGPGEGSSMCLWVNPSSMYASGYTSIAMGGGYGGTLRLAFSYNFGVVGASFLRQMNYQYCSEFSFDPSDGWHHYALTTYYGDDEAQTNADARLYIDGVDIGALLGKTYNTATPTTGPLLLGFGTNGTDVALQLDDYMWADSVLSQAQIQDIMANSPWSKA